MKLKSALTLLLLTAWTALAQPTIVTYYGTNFFNGLALTNDITLEPLPDYGVTLLGAGFITGPAVTPTLTNSSSAFRLAPGSYRLSWAQLPYSVRCDVPSTNITLNLASLVSSGAGMFTYTNNANFTVYGSPGDSAPGTLTEKISVTGGLTLTTNTVGSSKLAVIGLPGSNSIFGAFTGNGSNLVNLRATNIQANSGYLDNTLFAPLYSTNLTWITWLRNAHAVAAAATNSFALGGYANSVASGSSIGVMILGGYTNTIQGASYNSTIIAGHGQRMDYNTDAVIVGGNFNGITLGTASGILGGDHNLLYGAQNAIIGGTSNQIGAIGIPQNATGNVILGGTNNILGGSYNVIGGVNVVGANSGCFIWASPFGGTNFSSTADNQVLFRATGGMGINTNNPGTNTLRVNGYLDVTAGGITINGSNLFSLFPITTTSNGIIAIINTTSNALLGTINTASNVVAVAALNAQTSANAASNSIVVASNALITAIGPRKAFTATLPATFTSQGQAFTTPLMPDANYSVSLLPQDQQTAESQKTNAWWITSKTSSGFNITIPVQNSFQLNFDCIVNENTQ